MLSRKNFTFRILAFVALSLCVFFFFDLTGRSFIALALIILALCLDLRLDDSALPEVFRKNSTFLFFIVVTGLALFGLFHSWASQKGPTYTYFGLVPESDASNYYCGAQYFLERGVLNTWSARRPLPVFFYAIGLKACFNNLICLLVVLSVLCTLALCAAVRAVKKTHGYAAAACVLVLAYARFLSVNGSVRTEPLGFLFGCLAFTFLWTGFFSGKERSIRLGSFLLGLAFAIRPGALFAAGALCLFPSSSDRRLRQIAIRLGLFMASFLAPVLILYGVGTLGEAAYQGNFAHTLYGLAIGGQGWHAVLDRHPELAQITEDGKLSAEIYHLAFNEITADPSRFITALGKSYGSALAHLVDLLYLREFGTSIQNIFCALFLSLPWVLARSPENKKTALLCLGIFLGIFISYPVVVDAGLQRVLFVTNPFAFAFLGGGIGLSLKLLKTGTSKQLISPSIAPNRPLEIFAVFLSVTLLVGPFLLKSKASGPVFEETGMVEPKIVFHTTKNASVRIEKKGLLRVWPVLFFAPRESGKLYYFQCVANLLKQYEILYLLSSDDLEKVSGRYVSVSGKVIAKNRWGMLVEVLSAKAIEPTNRK